MNYTTFGPYRFSQLTLGTVQLGLDYGISNATGKPHQEESISMLKLAMDSGINTFDTARQYGNSEEVLGAFLSAKNNPSNPNIVSKFKVSAANLGNIDRAWKEVHESVVKSLGTLGLSTLPVCLLHKGDEPIREVMAILPEMIRRLMDEGLITLGGISAYFPEDVPWFLDYEEIAATQIPINVFDQRLVKTGLLNQLTEAGKLVFARSIFLQGLFFMDPAQLKGDLKIAEKYLKQLNELALQAQMSIAQLAFSFVRDLSGVNSIVFGAVNEEQIRQNISLLNGKAVPAEVTDQIKVLFSNIEENLLTPGTWKVS